MSNSSSSQKNKIIFNGKEIELKTLSGSVGPSVVDIRSLYSDLGIFTYDPGYGSTGSCESSITYIDGEELISKTEGQLGTIYWDHQFHSKNVRLDVISNSKRSDNTKELPGYLEKKFNL